MIGLIVMLAVWPTGLMAQHRYHVAACDWMMLKRQKIGEFKLAREIGADGVEMDMGRHKGEELFCHMPWKAVPSRIFAFLPFLRPGKKKNPRNLIFVNVCAGKKMVARIGIEPMTRGFSVPCSTN